MSRTHTLQPDKRNGKYYVWIQRKGVKKYFPFTGNKREAQKQLCQLEANIESGKISFASLKTTQQTTIGGKKDMRIEELVHRHLEWVEANRAKGTFDMRKYYVHVFLDIIGSVMVSEITRQRLEEFHIWAMNKENNRRVEKGLNPFPNAGYEAMRHIRTLLRWGEEVEIVELSYKRFPKLSYTPPPTRRVDDDELKTLLPNADQNFKDFTSVP